MKSTIVGAIGMAFFLGLTVSGARAGEGCVYQGAMYSDGASSCQAGVRYECDDGDWKSKKEHCSQERVIEHQAPSAQEHTIIKKKTEVED